MYGKRNLNNKLSEKDRVDYPIQFYAATKIERANGMLYSSLYKIPTTGLRFFTVYGPGRPDMSLFKFTKNILENKKLIFLIKETT